MMNLSDIKKIFRPLHVYSLSNKTQDVSNWYLLYLKHLSLFKIRSSFLLQNKLNCNKLMTKKNKILVVVHKTIKVKLLLSKSIKID